MIRYRYFVVPALLVLFGCRQNGGATTKVKAADPDNEFSVLDGIPEAQIRTDFEAAAAKYPAVYRKAVEDNLVFPNRPMALDASSLYLSIAKTLKGVSKQDISSLEDIRSAGWEVRSGTVYPTFRKIIDQIDAASKIRHCSFKLSGEDSSGVDLINFRHFTRLTIGAGELDLAKGNAAGFQKRMMAAVRMTKQLESSPSLLSTLVQASNVAIIVKACEAALQLKGDRADTRRAVSAVLAAITPPMLNGQTVAGEYAMFAQMLGDKPAQAFQRRMSGEEESEAKVPDSIAKLPPEVLTKALQYGALDWGNRFMAFLAEPRKGTGLEAIKRLHAVSDALANPPNSVDKLSAAMRPTWIGVYESTIREAAYVALGKSATLLCGMRSTSGSYPNQLPAGCPTDPFTGKPFLYRKSGSGFVVYSIGADGVDDGGISTAKDVIVSID